MIKIAIGLGNPGVRYANTYHNVGHLFIKCLETNAAVFSALTSRLSLLTSPVFMNESGAFVARALRKARAKPNELLLVHDDSDIALGSSKLSFGRGPAGHNGVASVIAALGTTDFSRLRIGIRNDRSQGKAGSFVLRKISKEDRALLDAAFSEAMGKLSRAEATEKENRQAA